MKRALILLTTVTFLAGTICQNSPLASEYASKYGEDQLKAEVKEEDKNLIETLTAEEDPLLHKRLSSEILKKNQGKTVLDVLNLNIEKFALSWVANMMEDLIKYYGVADDEKFIEMMKSDPSVYGLTYANYLIFERFK